MKADLTCFGLQLDFFHCQLICKLISCITDDTLQKQRTKRTKMTFFFCLIQRKMATHFISLD